MRENTTVINISIKINLLLKELHIFKVQYCINPVNKYFSA